MKLLIGIFFIAMLLLATSKVKIKILSLQKDRKKHDLNFHVNLGLYLFGVIKIFSIHLKNDGIHILGFVLAYQNMKIDDLKVKNLKLISILEILKMLNFKLDETKIDLKVGTENILFTIFSVFAISTFLSIFLTKNRKKINRKNYFYQVVPIYNSNELSFKISLKFSMNTVNLIKIFVFKNSKKEEKKIINEDFKIKSPLKI